MRNMEIRKGNFKNSYTGELTTFLDKNYKHKISGFFKHYALVTDYGGSCADDCGGSCNGNCDESRCSSCKEHCSVNTTFICANGYLLIRLPGKTVGCLQIDENSVITEIQIFTWETSKYTEGINDLLTKKFVGERLIMI